MPEREGELDLVARLILEWARSHYPELRALRWSVELSSRTGDIEEVRMPLSGCPMSLPPGEDTVRISGATNVFVPTPFQKGILKALDGKALRTDALADAVGSRRRIFQHPGGIKELCNEGMAAHRPRLGYYRPDKPPAGMGGPAPAEKRRRFVYFIQASSVRGPIKIGTAFNPRTRLQALQTQHPKQLTLLGALPGGFEKEAEIHRRFASALIKGEWFKPTPELLEFIRAEAKPWDGANQPEPR